MTSAFNEAGSSTDATHVYEAAAVDKYIEDLHRQIADLRHSPASGRPPEPPEASADNAEAILGRALLGAQRTIDEKIAEAEERAQQILAAAQDQAADLVSRARSEAERIIDEAHEKTHAAFVALKASRMP
jgi:cell division septum initiation protein DivIVA